MGGVTVALKVGELYSTLELDARKFNQGIAAAQTQVKGMSTMLKVGLAGAAVAAGAALYKMAKTGLQNVRELDDAVKQFQVATGSSAAEAEKAQKVIQKLYRQNTDSYAELGAAVTRLQQRYGDLGDDLEKHTQSFLDFAKVTGQDTTQAIDDVTNILLAFNRELEDAVPLMDSLLAVSQTTGANLSTLQRALAEAAPAMVALNIPLEEGIALLGHLEARGVGADAAVRGLRYAMQALENPTKEQAEALRVLNIKCKEVEEGVYKVAEDAFPTLLRRLSEGSLSSREMDAALRILGMRAGQDMVRGLQGGEEGIKSLMNTIKESEGVVNEASKTYDKQLGERWELIRRKYLVPFMETLGEGLLKVLEDVAGFLDEWGPQIEAVFESMKATIQSFYTFCKWAFSNLTQILLEFYDTVYDSAAMVDEAYEYVKKRYDPNRIKDIVNELTGGSISPKWLLPMPEFEEAKMKAPLKLPKIEPTESIKIPVTLEPVVDEVSFTDQIDIIADKVKYMNMPLKDAINQLEKMKVSLTPLSDEWKKATDLINKFKEELVDAEKEQARLAGISAAAEIKRIEKVKQMQLEAQEAAAEGVRRFWQDVNWEYNQGLVDAQGYFDMLKGELERVTQGSEEWKRTFEDIQRVALDIVNTNIDTLSEQLEAGKITTEEFNTYVAELKEQFQDLPLVVNQLDDALKNTKRTTEDLTLQTQLWARDLSKGLADAIVYCRSLSDVLNNILRQIASSMLQKLIFGWLPFEKGGVINKGKLQPFASGGIVASPTIFPMANGAGLMGEAGPEAIMPLKRTSSGDLGVKAEGAGVTNITMNINAVDANSFVQMLRHNKAAITSLVVENILNNGQIRRTIQGVT